MISKKTTAWSIIFTLLSFVVITFVTASFEANTDGTNDYGFPLRFYRTGGNSLNIYTGEHQGAEEFDIVSLGVDLALTLILVLFVRFIMLKYKRKK